MLIYIIKDGRDGIINIYSLWMLLNM